MMFKKLVLNIARITGTDMCRREITHVWRPSLTVAARLKGGCRHSSGSYQLRELLQLAVDILRKNHGPLIKRLKIPT